MSLWQKIKAIIKHTRNRRELLGIVLGYIIILLGAGIILAPHWKEIPCIVCGRIAKKSVRSLYFYKEGVIPYVREVNLWYCSRHLKSAKESVNKLPDKKDTIGKRYQLIIITGLIGFVAYFLVLVLLNLPIAWLAVYPALVLIIFLFWGFTSNITLAIFVILTVIFPIIVYFIWHKIVFERGRWTSD